MIKGGNVTVFISDMDKAVKFYTETLGLKLKRRFEDEWAEVEVDGLTIGLHPVGKWNKTGDSKSLSIGLGVKNLEEEMNRLKAKGVAFSQVIDDKQVRIAYFTDIDKNPLYLVETSE